MHALYDVVMHCINTVSCMFMCRFHSPDLGTSELTMSTKRQASDIMWPMANDRTHYSVVCSRLQKCIDAERRPRLLTCWEVSEAETLKRDCSIERARIAQCESTGCTSSARVARFWRAPDLASPGVDGMGKHGRTTSCR